MKAVIQKAWVWGEIWTERRGEDKARVGGGWLGPRTELEVRQPHSSPSRASTAGLLGCLRTLQGTQFNTPSPACFNQIRPSSRPYKEEKKLKPWGVRIRKEMLERGTHGHFSRAPNQGPAPGPGRRELAGQEGAAAATDAA